MHLMVLWNHVLKDNWTHARIVLIDRCSFFSFPSCLQLIVPRVSSGSEGELVQALIQFACRYHAIHHTKREANFCLFMPLFDLLGGTLDARSWEMQEQTSAGTDTTPRAT
jgi:hypothetical protein